MTCFSSIKELFIRCCCAEHGAPWRPIGAFENNRRARFYRLTRARHKLLETEKDWEQTAAIIARFLK